MRKRIVTGIILAALLFLTVNFADAWPLRVGLMACFGIALFEIWASATYGRTGLNSRSSKAVRDPRGKRALYVQVIVLVIAAAAIVTRPIRSSEMLAVAIATYMADIGGYFIGQRYGKHKVYELRNISQSKTWEGYIGAVVASLTVTGVFLLMFGRLMPVFPKFMLWLCGGAVGCLGDLLGSATKRELAIKDADDVTRHLPVVQQLEKLMTGHGGYLDRFDSLSLVVVFYYLLLMINRLFS